MIDWFGLFWFFTPKMASLTCANISVDLVLRAPVKRYWKQAQHFAPLWWCTETELQNTHSQLSNSHLRKQRITVISPFKQQRLDFVFSAASHFFPGGPTSYFILAQTMACWSLVLFSQLYGGEESNITLLTQVGKAESRIKGFNGHNLLNEQNATSAT